MAKLTNFKRDSKAIAEGEWISPGEEYEDLEIMTRGYTDMYADTRASRLRRAVTTAGVRSVESLPSATVRTITVECLISHVLLDVRGLAHEDGTPVSFGEFCELLRNPDYGDLFVAAVTAASRVGMKRAEDLADALGNSEAPSAQS